MVGASEQAGACYTPSEVAEVLKVSPKLVGKLIENKSLDAVRIEKEWRISGDGLSSFLSKNLNQNLPKASIRRRPRRITTIFVGIGILLVAASVIGAQIAAVSEPVGDPSVIPYQGYLEQAGTPKDGSVRVTFTLEDKDAAPVGWEESHDVAVVGGRFSTQLGSITPLDSYLSESGLFLKVGVQELDELGEPVGDLVALSGRQLLSSVPYALRGAPGKDFVVDQNLGVGTNSPEARLDVAGTAQSDYLVVNPENDSGEGGEISLQGSNGNNDWNIDTSNGNFRLHHDGSVYLSVSNGGNVSVSGEMSASSISVEGTISTGCVYQECSVGDWGQCTCPEGTYIQTGGCNASTYPYYMQANNPLNLTTWTCGGHGGSHIISIICCRQN